MPLKICRRLLARYEAEWDSFLTRIFTADDTWIHYHSPESMVSPKNCRKGKGAPVPAVRLCVLYSDAYFPNLLKTQVKPAYRSKRRSIPAQSTIILQDNARPRSASFTVEEFVRKQLTDLLKEFFDSSIKKLPERCQKCVSSEVNHLKKIVNFFDNK